MASARERMERDEERGRVGRGVGGTEGDGRRGGCRRQVRMARGNQCKM